jgi:general secretion pathway protein F/type IV pilus assembly protein PilC
MFLRKQDEMRSKIVGALTYPIILGIVGTVITSLMVVFLVPKFQPFFDRLEQNGTGLPLITVLLLGASHTLMNYGVFVLLAAAAIGIGIYRLLKTEAGQRMLDRVKLRTPLVGVIFHDAACSATVCRFSSRFASAVNRPAMFSSPKR